jgi:hypothetical protein
MRIISILTLIVCGSCLTHKVFADEYRTPRAGEGVRTVIWGEPITAPFSDRHRITAFSLGVQWIPDGPSSPLFLPFGGALVIQKERSQAGDDLIQPFGAFFVWRNLDEGRRRARAVLSGLYNDVRLNYSRKSWHGAELIFTFENLTVPFGRPEFIEGQRIDPVELEWYYLRGGFGLGYRRSLAPGNQENALELALTYEPGFLWFNRDDTADPNFILPRDTYEGRVHFRLRADKLERNIMELPHQGFALGTDWIYGRRATWKDWGGPVFGAGNGDKQRDFFSASAYAVAAGPVPFVNSERHRLIGSIYGGIGKDLDRYSAFRLNGRPTVGEWEALSSPDLPGAAFLEFYSRNYGILELRYRYEALFFLYPYVRANWAWIDRPRFKEAGRVAFQTDAIPSVGAGFTTGAPWKSQIEFNYTYSFGMLRSIESGPEFGGHAVLFTWSKGF